MAKLIIFGTADFAQIACQYFTNDSDHDVVAFTLNQEFITQDTFEGKPVVPFEEIEKKYPPNQFKMFVALGYSKMNKIREKKYQEAVTKGYELVSYISSRCSYLSENRVGANTFIFEDNTVQPYVKIGNNCILWSGNHIGHHSTIEDHNFISSHVVISGRCHMGPNCFFGVNSSIGDRVKIAAETLVGAGAVLAKDTEPKGVYVAPRPVILEKKSDQINL